MEELKSLNLIYEETKIQTERQFRILEALDNKAGIIAGLTGVIFGIVAISTPSYLRNSIWILSLILLVSSSILSLLGIVIEKWRSDPLPSGMKDYLTKDEIESKRQFLENLITSYDYNKRKLNRKVKWIQTSIWVLIGGIITVLILICFN